MRGELSQEMFNCIPEIDFSVGHRYFIGNMDNYARALMSTLKSIKAKLPILNSMILSQEYAGLRIISQTLRKMLSNVGALGLSYLSYRIETLSLNENTSALRDELTIYIHSLTQFAEHVEILITNTNSNNQDKQGSTEDNTNSFLGYDFTKTRESIKLSSDYLGRRII